jgi:hypothetical protein
MRPGTIHQIRTRNGIVRVSGPNNDRAAVTRQNTLATQNASHALRAVQLAPRRGPRDPHSQCHREGAGNSGYREDRATLRSDERLTTARARAASHNPVRPVRSNRWSALRSRRVSCSGRARRPPFFMRRRVSHGRATLGSTFRDTAPGEIRVPAHQQGKRPPRQ